MGEVAHRLQVVLVAVVHGDEREFDQTGVVVHDALEVLEPDAPVARHHDTEVQAGLTLECLQVDDRALEMERVGYDVSPGAWDAEALHDHHLASARVRDEADLGGICVDERSKLGYAGL